MTTYLEKPLIKKALNDIISFHKDQVDKQDIPIIFHLMDVAYICHKKYGYLDYEYYQGTQTTPLDVTQLICVALLHDILEDTHATESYLRDNYPSEIVDAVVILTRKFDESYTEYIYRVKENKLATNVKLCDLEHNIIKCYSKSEFKTLKDRYVNALTILNK